MRLLVMALICVAIVAPRADAGRGAALLKYLPPDATSVLVVDVAKARRSPLFATVLGAARDQHSELDKLLTATELDKVSDTLVIAGDRSDQFVAVWEGKLAKVMAGVKARSSKEDKHAGITYFTLPEGEVAMIGPHLVWTTAGTMTAVIDRATAKRPAKPAAAVRTIIAAASKTAAVFGGAVFQPTERQDLATELGAEPQWAALSFGLAKTLAFEVHLAMADAAGATAAVSHIQERLAADGLRGQLEVMVGKAFSQSISVEQKQAGVRGAAVMTGDELDKLVAIAKLVM